MTVTALDALLEELAEAEALLLEPQDMFNTCLIGTAQRADGIHVAAYDSNQVIAVLQVVNHWDYDEALEWFEFNIAGAYLGDGSPVFIDLMELHE